jgi:anthranilate phosphoribosyltransferase
MLDELRRVVLPLLDGRDIDAAGMEQAVAAIMDGRCDPAEIACVLTALRCRGESVPQLVGAARAMRARSLKIPCRRRGLLDTCGTGGDSLHTFNISTATAFVAAAAGATVAKHGNRSASSKSGSADVLEALGVSLALTPEQTAQCIDEIGLGFCFAPRLHAAMKSAAPVRQQLGFRTIFNLLGPLTNPASAEYQVIGAGRTHLAELIATALAELGTGRTLVVCGNDELDEVSLWGETAVFVVESKTVTRETWSPETLGLPVCHVQELRVSSPVESAALIHSVLNGESGSARDIVLANAAAALVACQLAAHPLDGVARARAAIDSGSAAQLLQQFVQRTQELAKE